MQQAKKRAWQGIAVFIICLVISLPIYSASALAATVQITRNSGEEGIEQFLDADGDVWTLNALISGLGDKTVNPGNVTVKIGDNKAPFQSCSPAALGGVSCEYISPLTDGIKEAEYAFQVIYLPDSSSDGDLIRADGSAPTITGLSASHNADGLVHVSFTVQDKIKGSPAVGIQSVNVIDADSNAIVQSFTDFEIGKEEFSYSGTLPTSFSGEGIRRLKVTAVDWLGHSITTSPVSFPSDFVKPVIVESSLEFTRLGKFIGSLVTTTDITVDVIENNLQKVVASSVQAELSNTEAVCEEDEEETGLWHCAWEDVEVLPESAISVTVIASDSFGNIEEKTISTAFTPDTLPPEVEFFGTERIFSDVSYVTSGEQRIIVRIKEEGSGLSKEGVRANLGALGKGSSEEPLDCVSLENVYECYWETSQVFSSDGVARISLSTLEDNVGNEGLKPEVELRVDTGSPTVEKLEVYGVSEIGEKDFFQSNDLLKIKLSVIESSGLFILVNLNDLVNDAETIYPAEYVLSDLPPEDGWRVYSQEENCQRGEAEWQWDCVIETEALKSGPDKSAELEIRVLDTAGNDAAEWPAGAKNVAGDDGDYTLDLLGLAEEENPDFWEVSKGYPKLNVPFVDLDVARLTYAKMPVQIKLKSDNANVQVLRMDLLPGSCQAVEGGPELSRALLYGGSSAEGQKDPVTNVILEFAPFEGKQKFTEEQFAEEEASAEYVCQIRVYSRIGNKAIKVAEVQEVHIEVPFSFSELGAIDENLAKRIRDVRESDFFKFGEVLTVINEVLNWIKYILNWVTLLNKLFQIFDLFSENMKGIADGVEQIPPAAAAAQALRGNCLQLQGAQTTGWEFMDYIQIPLQILNCNPGVFYQGDTEGMSEEKRLDTLEGKVDVTGIDVISWYAWWQSSVLDFYNLASGRGPLGFPAQSLYENMYLSMIGLCVPGVVFNLQKAQEIHCRKIICYGREVPAGIATIDACNDLYDLQMCEFVWGPVFDFVGLGALSYIGKALKALFSSPLGLIRLVKIVVCFPVCFIPKSGGVLTACKVATGFTYLIDIVDTVISSIENRPDTTGSPYCKTAEKIKIEELAPEPEEEAPVEESV